MKIPARAFQLISHLGLGVLLCSQVFSHPCDDLLTQTPSSKPASFSRSIVQEALQKIKALPEATQAELNQKRIALEHLRTWTLTQTANDRELQLQTMQLFETNPSLSTLQSAPILQQQSGKVLAQAQIDLILDNQNMDDYFELVDNYFSVASESIPQHRLDTFVEHADFRSLNRFLEKAMIQPHLIDQEPLLLKIMGRLGGSAYSLMARHVLSKLASDLRERWIDQIIAQGDGDDLKVLCEYVFSVAGLPPLTEARWMAFRQAVGKLPSHQQTAVWDMFTQKVLVRADSDFLEIIEALVADPSWIKRNFFYNGAPAALRPRLLTWIPSLSQDAVMKIAIVAVKQSAGQPASQHNRLFTSLIQHLSFSNRQKIIAQIDQLRQHPTK